MRNEKCLSLAAALIIAVFFISLGGVQASSFSSGLIATSPYTSGSTSSVSSLFSSSQCKAGQDFVLQVSPTGCTPSVIRSDLLEEQNVPVFCPIVATKINPLIDVNAINNVIISGATSSEVSGTDFLPNRAALKSSVRSQITSPVLGSIGYAVIVLKQQAESELANCESTVFGDVCWVEGTLTAKLNYDIQNAFGIGQSTFYLPATSDAEWNQNYKKYSFWNGRGYLRAESIESDGATISVYSGSNSRNSETTRTASVGIPVGGTSQDISIPGFDFCLGTMKLKLNGLENPDTTATFDINGNPAEVKVGESFLNNRCTVKSIDKQGINQKVSVRCNEDDGSNPLNFVSSPKIKLNIDGVNRTVSAGDWVYNTDDSKSVYVAYVRTKGDTNSEQDLSVSLAAIPTEVGKTKLTDSELNSFARFMATFPDKDVDSIMSFGTTVYKIYASGLESLYRGWVIGQDFKDVGYSDSAGKVLFKKTIKVVGFADPVNVDLSVLSANAQTDYENALKDYQKVLDDYTSEKYPSDDQKTLGQRALENLIKLDDAVSQKRNVVEFCAQFKESFSNVKIPEECVNAVELSNSDFGTRDVLVGGRVYRMTLTNIREPTSTEFGAQISVKKPDGEVVTPTLKKNQIVYLDSKILYSYDAGILSSAVYYRYQENKWQWSEDQKTWADTSSSSASSSGQSNVVNKLANSGLDAGVNHLKGLKAKDLSSDVYVQLLDISKDSSGENVVRIATNLREGVVDAIGNILVGQ
ncbi:MAG: hypothetical protein KJ879_02475, partial [Nanoarchaeota archaeon]|nr:hypothetical protein [Nanoarchaeota archaeon]